MTHPRLETIQAIMAERQKLVDEADALEAGIKPTLDHIGELRIRAQNLYWAASQATWSTDPVAA